MTIFVNNFLKYRFCLPCWPLCQVYKLIGRVIAMFLITDFQTIFDTLGVGTFMICHDTFHTGSFNGPLVIATKAKAGYRACGRHCVVFALCRIIA
jgi:hypothetical protein